MHPDLDEVLFTEEQLMRSIRSLGERLSQDYEHSNPLFICVLKGAVMFMADLVKQVTVPLEMDFIAISSYGASSKSSGVVRILKDLDRSVEGRDIVIVEDIVDTGLTLAYLKEIFIHRRANSVKVAALFDKPEGRKVEIQPDYYCFQVPNAFIVGYGLDYAEHYRNLPFVGVLKPSVYIR